MYLPLKRISLICIFITAYLLLLLYQWYFTGSGLQIQEILNNNHRTNVSAVRERISMKYILQWTSRHTEPFAYWGEGQEEFTKRKCKFKKCYVTANRMFLPSMTEFDAVAFHGPEITNYVAGPATRSPHQKYVYVSMESSHNYPICEERYDGYFNWTWTYKLDSDEPYGYITVRNMTGNIIGPKKIMHWIKLDSMLQIDNETKVRLEKKKKAAAWFVSNCHSLSRREAFVFQLKRELRRYSLDIDIFGGCTSKKCPRTKMHECLEILQEDYYFYLALENSFSEDYVTEKLLTALQNYAVPVVYGGANYTRFMPDGIYLHAGELQPADLAKEMNDIIKDKQRYYSFFKWRNHYSYHHKDEAADSDHQCRMCEMLHDETLMNKNTVYIDFRTWWNVPEACSSRSTKLYCPLVFINYLSYFIIYNLR